ncbi:cyclin D [Musca autumnalis]|uniref:cyclin D n=1 Tax=Musca autumnalis TaxID=221902 RepID=UPI003CE72862
MDLLCTENIINEYETETLCHHQKTFQKQSTSPLKTEQQSTISTNNNSNISPTSLYSSSSSLSSSSCCSSATNSSGYNSTSSSSSSCHSSSKLLACEETANSYLETCAPTKHQEQQQQQVAYQKHSSASNNSSVTSSAGQNVYTNHLIHRSLDYVNTATEDPTFLTDRCLENALKAEEKRPQPICTYFKTIQKDITPPMRKIVAEWMMEVCAEEKCQEEVVLLALNYMDRFLSTKSVRKTHLQILAAACLLLASKLREPSCRALSAELLVFYTDNSIHKADLIKWELFVLSRLGWDLSCVTPLDFLELLLIRLPIRSADYPDLDVDKVRQHAQAFISLAAKEHHFSMYSASTIAASSIAAALSGLNWHLRTGQNLRHLLNLLTDLTSVEQDNLHDCMMQMETIFEEHSRNLQPYLGSVEYVQQQHQSNSCLSSSDIGSASILLSPGTVLTASPTIGNQSQYNQNQIHQSYHHSYHGYHHHDSKHQQQQQLQYNHHYQNQQQQQQHHFKSLHHHSTVPTSISASSPSSSSSSSSSSHDVVKGSVTANVLLPDLTQTCKMQANAQKEVQDIQF